MAETDILILERARAALQKHHDWHLDQKDIPGCAVSMAIPDEYSETAMHRETIAALDQLNAEIHRRIGKEPSNG